MKSYEFIKLFKVCCQTGAIVRTRHQSPVQSHGCEPRWQGKEFRCKTAELTHNWLYVTRIATLPVQLSTTEFEHGVRLFAPSTALEAGCLALRCIDVGVCCDIDLWMGWRWLKVRWRYVEVMRVTLGLPIQIVRSPGLALGLYHETWPQVFQRSRSPKRNMSWQWAELVEVEQRPLQPLHHERISHVSRLEFQYALRKYGGIPEAFASLRSEQREAGVGSVAWNRWLAGWFHFLWCFALKSQH